MIAIGFLLMVVGFCLYRIFGIDPVTHYFTHRLNAADYIGFVMATIGFVLTIAGFVSWLWKYMP